MTSAETLAKWQADQLQKYALVEEQKAKMIACNSGEKWSKEWLRDGPRRRQERVALYLLENKSVTPVIQWKGFRLEEMPSKCNTHFIAFVYWHRRLQRHVFCSADAVMQPLIQMVKHLAVHCAAQAFSWTGSLDALPVHNPLLTLQNARLCLVPCAGQAFNSITTLQHLPPHAKAVLCVMVSLMKVHVYQPVTLLLTDSVIPGFIRTYMLDSALSASKLYSFEAQQSLMAAFVVYFTLVYYIRVS